MSRQPMFTATEEGSKLELTAEQEKNLKVVYKKRDDGEGYVFDSLWSPEHEYSKEYAIAPIRSVFGGTEPYGPQQKFANVIGSKNDPRPKPCWLDLFEEHHIPYKSCVTDGNFYASADGVEWRKDDPIPHYACNHTRHGGNMVGGHVLKDATTAGPVVDDEVYLIPICKSHNSSRPIGGPDPGVGYYMKTANAGIAIKLKNYLPEPKPEDED